MFVRMERKLYKFANIYLESMSKEEALQHVSSFVETGKYHYQISINVAKLVFAQKDEKLLKSINSADIINADGMPIKVIAGMISGKETARMGGLDYMDGLAEKFPDWKYYFLGAKQEVIESVVKHYEKKIQIVGWRNGYFAKDELDGIIDDINGKHTDILFIAMGTPQKEYMLYDLRKVLKCKFAVGVGGAFNIIAGKQKRAPQWIQNIGMEWFYRLCQEPGRMWKRYLYTNSSFLLIIMRETVKSIFQKREVLIKYEP
jgi:N-acetylglucosaminyldiphosphoundecaprenol N-acetyl-beta-D-mannosaminyltransferase